MTLRMSAEAAERVRTRFRDTAEDLEGARDALRGLSGDLDTGAGEFAVELGAAGADFQGSWEAVLEVFADSSALIGRNTNALHLSLTAYDEAAADEIDLGPRPAPDAR